MGQIAKKLIIVIKIKGDKDMNSEVDEYIKQYSQEIQNLFMEVRKIVKESVPNEIEEKLWAKLPSYYVEDKFVRLIPFKNHINIEAEAIMWHEAELKEYKITPKGMLQIYLKQNIPSDILQAIFKETYLGAL